MAVGQEYGMLCKLFDTVRAVRAERELALSVAVPKGQARRYVIGSTVIIPAHGHAARVVSFLNDEPAPSPNELFPNFCFRVQKAMRRYRYPRCNN